MLGPGQDEYPDRRRSDTLAANASEQVRAIVEAAEARALRIHRQAEADAQEIRGEASADANAARVHATGEARHYVGRVSESTVTLLDRIEAMQTELEAVAASLRTGGQRLARGLELLEAQLREVRDAVAREPGSAERRPAPAAVLPSSRAPLEPLVPQEEGEEEEKSHGDLLDSRSDDARLIALNMALDGAPREETERYLEQHFAHLDGHSVVEQVYASIER